MSKHLKFLVKLTVVLLFALNLRAGAQGTAFTYQGQLGLGGSAATGNFDFRFTIFDAVTNGVQVGFILTNAPVGVTNGLFTTTVDFSNGVFTGPARWLDIGVRTNGATNTAYTDLVPRQLVTAVPYAIFAGSASNLTGELQATQLLGTVSSAQINGSYTNSVTFTSGSNSFVGSFAGNGINLTNLNGSQITVGTIADARLTTNVALLNADQTFSGANTMSNWNNSFTGSFYGNGLVGWNAVSNTAFQAVVDHGYVLTNSLLVNVTLPASPNVGDIVRLAGAGAGGWQIGLTNNHQSILGNFSSYNNVLWNPSSAISGNWECLASSSDGSRLVGGIYGGGLYVSDNYGSTWTAATGSTPASADWRAITCSADGTKVVAAVYGGNIYTNAGTAWASASSSSTVNFISAASSSDGSKLVAVAYGGNVYSSISSGATWYTRTTGLPNSGVANWQCVASSANGNNLALGVNGGGIYLSSNAGTNWTESPAPSNLSWFSIASSSSGSRLFASALGWGLYLSTNSGSSWSQLSGVPTNNCYAVAMSADGSKLAAVIGKGGVYLSSNLGNTWSLQTSAPSTNWYAITMSSDGSHIVAAANGTSPTGPIYVSQSTSVTTSTLFTNSVYGGQGSAVELQYIGNSEFMPVSSAGSIWGN